METIRDIKEAVENRGSVLTISMETLRKAYGSGKLGKHVLDGISKELSRNGLGHFPDPLPNFQHETARLFELGSQVAALIEAANRVSEESDEILRSASGGHDAEIVRKVRELVC